MGRKSWGYDPSFPTATVLLAEYALLEWHKPPFIPGIRKIHHVQFIKISVTGQEPGHKLSKRAGAGRRENRIIPWPVL